MYISTIKLQNFRSYAKSEFTFTSDTTVIVGPNTAGKTNILEAIFLLSTGKSFRADRDVEMIKFNEEIGRVYGVIVNNDSNSDVKLEIILTNGMVAKTATPKKKYSVNGVPKRQIDFAGLLRAVLFAPTDLDLITDSPSLRRKYLDFVLLQIDRDYRRALLSYEKGLRQRNRLLERIRDEGVSHSQLGFWDELLIKNGQYMTQKRREYVSYINYNLKIADALKKDGKDSIRLQIVYDSSEISKDRLKQYEREEVASATTLVGPHRDDWSIKKYLSSKVLRCSSFALRATEGKQESWVEVSLFGSRGEQRMAVLWLKMCELEYINDKTGQRPVLLLDDIFSELDDNHRGLIMEVVPKQQTIITTTDIEHIDKMYLEGVNVIKL